MGRLALQVHFDRTLGAGGEGQVYLASSRNSGTQYAVKYSNELDVCAQAAALRKERDRHLRASGDGIVRLVDHDLDAVRPYLVYELAERGSLLDEIEQLRRLQLRYRPQEALARIADVLRGLRTVHGRGMIHRDIKPANLLFFRDELKISDFGLGRTFNRPVSPLLTTFRAGTPAYAAPEQVLGDEVDPRTDFYPIGVILVEMLTGSRPTYHRPLVLPFERKLREFATSLLSIDPSGRPADVDQCLRAFSALRLEHWQQLDERSLATATSPFWPSHPATGHSSSEARRVVGVASSYIERYRAFPRQTQPQSHVPAGSLAMSLLPSTPPTRYRTHPHQGKT